MATDTKVERKTTTESTPPEPQERTVKETTEVEVEQTNPTLGDYGTDGGRKPPAAPTPDN